MRWVIFLKITLASRGDPCGRPIYGRAVAGKRRKSARTSKRWQRHGLSGRRYGFRRTGGSAYTAARARSRRVVAVVIESLFRQRKTRRRRRIRTRKRCVRTRPCKGLNDTKEIGPWTTNDPLVVRQHLKFISYVHT